MNESLRTPLLRQLEASSDRPLLTVLGRRAQASTYCGEQLVTEAQLRSQYWQKLLGPGPHVLIAALPAGEEFFFALLASLLDEGTLVPIAPPRANDPPERLRQIVETCEATAILCNEAQRTVIESHLRDLEGRLTCSVIAVDGNNSEGPLIPRRHMQRAPIIQHTSGSTRFPKALPISARQIQANCSLIQNLWGMEQRTKMLNWLPHYHDMGLMGGILYPLLSGACSIQMSPFEMIRNPLIWLQAISTHQATFSGGPAFAFQDCLNRIREEDCVGIDLSSWQRAYCGAEPIPAGLLQRFRQRFARNGLAAEAVFACYGMAEFTLFAAGQPGISAQPATAEPNPAAEPCVLGEHTRQNLRVTDSQSGQPLPDGQSGEIWLRGESASTKYLGLVEESRQAFDNLADGSKWLRTGDLGYVNGNLLYVTGRQKDIVIVNGRNVSAAEIEWLAGQQDPALNTLAAAAFTPPGANNGQAVLFIEVRPGQALPADREALGERIRRAVVGALSIELTDIRILPRGSLARTSSGKIRRQQIAAAYDEAAQPLHEEITG